MAFSSRPIPRRLKIRFPTVSTLVFSGAGLLHPGEPGASSLTSFKGHISPSRFTLSASICVSG